MGRHVRPQLCSKPNDLRPWVTPEEQTWVTCCLSSNFLFLKCFMKIDRSFEGNSPQAEKKTPMSNKAVASWLSPKLRRETAKWTQANYGQEDTRLGQDQREEKRELSPPGTSTEIQPTLSDRSPYSRAQTTNISRIVVHLPTCKTVHTLLVRHMWAHSLIHIHTCAHTPPPELE